MMDTRLEVASENLLMLLGQSDGIYEEDFLELFESFARTLKMGYAFGPRFKELCDTANFLFDFSAPSDVDSEHAFNLGACWSLAGIKKSAEEIEDENSKNELLKQAIKDNKELVDAIKELPGICHKELATAIHMSPSALSQKIGRLPEGILVSNRAGRQKRYYLTSIAADILATIELSANTFNSNYVSHINNRFPTIDRNPNRSAGSRQTKRRSNIIPLRSSFDNYRKYEDGNSLNESNSCDYSSELLAVN